MTFLHSARTEGLSRPSVITAASCWMLLVCNVTFWNRLIDGREPGRPDELLFLAATAVLLLLMLNAVIGVLAVGRLLRPVLIVFVLIAAAGSAFVDRYGVLIDRDMVQNVFETDVAESRELMDPRLLGWMLLAGGLPALCIARLRLRPEPPGRTLRRHLCFVVANLAGATGLFVLFSAEYASEIRGDRALRYQFNPLNAIYATARALRPQRPAPVPVPIGADARRPPARAGAGPNVFVLVVGETARAVDFSLNAHERPTNPRLEAADVVYFTQVSACGTSTAVSLPCMFSGLGRSAYDESAARARENLLDVLARTGLDVLWLDNNSGCKGVCARVRTELLSASADARYCRDGECHDGILVERLRTLLAGIERDSVIVLHQKGSHGPAYWRRYPPAFERFTPVCRSINLDDCSPESLHNAYDNTILYTDHVLAEIIDSLRAAPGLGGAAMLYVSDHGESLGEAGIYLHGAPRAIAPAVQYEIPMIFWASSGFAGGGSDLTACLRDRAGHAYSHDNLFHSMLGVLDVSTQVYRSALDLFAPCRTGAGR